MERAPIPVVVALLLNHGRVFLVRRARTKPLAGQWEFPGGKVEIGEAPEDALRRELGEEVGLSISRFSLFGAYSYVYDFPGGPVHYILLAYRMNVRDGSWSKRGAWIGAHATKGFKIVAGSRPIVADLITAKLLRRVASKR